MPVGYADGFRRDLTGTEIRVAGESRRVDFRVGPNELSYIGPTMRRVVEPGKFDLMVGGSSVALQKVVVELRE